MFKKKKKKLVQINNAHDINKFTINMALQRSSKQFVKRFTKTRLYVKTRTF